MMFWLKLFTKVMSIPQIWDFCCGIRSRLPINVVVLVGMRDMINGETTLTIHILTPVAHSNIQDVESRQEPHFPQILQILSLTEYSQLDVSQSSGRKSKKCWNNEKWNTFLVQLWMRFFPLSWLLQLFWWFWLLLLREQFLFGQFCGIADLSRQDKL